MKSIKLLFWLTGIIIFLGLGVVLVVTTLVDPNDYKPHLEKLVEENTGRQLKIGGDLGLTFYPWIGLKTGEVEFSDREGFGDAPMLSAKQVSVKVRLIPLLNKNLEVGEVNLIQPSLKLITQENGNTNWGDLINQEGSTDGDAGSQTLAITRLAIQGVSIEDGKLLWNDQVSGQTVMVSNMNLSTGLIQPGEPLDVELSALLEGNAVPEPMQVEINTTINISENLKNLNLKNTAATVVMGDRNHRLSVPNLTYDLAEHNLDVPEFEIGQNDVIASGNLKASNLIGTPAISGQIAGTAPDIKNTLKMNGIAVDLDPHKIDNILLSSGFNYLNNIAELKNLSIDANFNGQTAHMETPLASMDFSKETIEMSSLDVNFSETKLAIKDVVVDSFLQPQLLKFSGEVKFVTDDLEKVLEQNHYGSLLGEDTDKESQNEIKFHIGGIDLQSTLNINGKSIEINETVIQGVINDQKTNINLDRGLLNIDSQAISIPRITILQSGLELEGSVKGESLFSGLEISNLSGSASTKVRNLSEFLDRSGYGGILPDKLISEFSNQADFMLRDGALSLSPVDTTADDTRLAGTVSIKNISSDQDSIISVKHQIQNIDIGRILSSFEITDDFTGLGEINIDLFNINTAHEKPISQTSGEIGFALRDGAITGFDLQSTLIKINEALNRGAGPQENTEYTPGAKTRFSALSGSFTGNQGRFETVNLNLKAPGVRIQGRGVINLFSETVDLKFDVSVVDTVEGQGGSALENLKGVTIPLKVYGKLAAPSYGLDLGKLLKGQLKKELEEELGRELEGSIKEEIQNELEKKLQEELSDELRKLLGD